MQRLSCVPGFTWRSSEMLSWSCASETGKRHEWKIFCKFKYSLPQRRARPSGNIEATMSYPLNTIRTNIICSRTLRDRGLDTFSKFPTVFGYTSCQIKRFLSRRRLKASGLSDKQSVGSSPAILSGVSDIYAVIVVRLELLQNMFLIERLLMKLRAVSGHCHQGLELLRLSVEMITLALIFWTHKDRLDAVHHDFEWLVMSYAAPAAGVLCMELVNPSSDVVGMSTVVCPYQLAGSNGTLLDITKCDIVQTLSLLVGFLEWIGPDAPNSDLCEAVKVAVKQVLRDSINGASSHGPVPDPPVEYDVAEFLNLESTSFPGFGFDLLNTFGWLREDPLVQEGLGAP